MSDKVPFIADMAPSGRYLMTDLYDVVSHLVLDVTLKSIILMTSQGGIPSVMKLLIAGGLLHDVPTVTGKTISENVASWPSLRQGQEIIRSLDNPIKKTGHIEILRGMYIVSR